MQGLQDEIGGGDEERKCRLESRPSAPATWKSNNSHFGSDAELSNIVDLATRYKL